LSRSGRDLRDLTPSGQPARRDLEPVAKSVQTFSVDRESLLETSVSPAITARIRLLQSTRSSWPSRPGYASSPNSESPIAQRVAGTSLSLGDQAPAPTQESRATASRSYHV
jgi:hypothetical protein